MRSNVRYLLWIFFAASILCSCVEEEIHHVFTVEVDIATPIDSAYALVSNHIQTKKVELSVINGVAVNTIETEMDCADVEIFLFRKISENDWINKVSSVERTYINNLPTTGVHHIKDAQQEPDLWTIEHWFENSALGGVQQHSEVNKCSYTVELIFESTLIEQPYIFYQHCVFENEELFDCAYEECLECPVNRGNVSIPLYDLAPWCNDLSLTHDLFTYIFYNNIEVFIGYF